MDLLRGPAMVLRLIPQTILTMEQLHLPNVLQSLAARPKGLILVTGATGSGPGRGIAHPQIPQRPESSPAGRP